MARQPGPGCGAAWRSHVDAGATGAWTCPLLDFRNQGRGGSERGYEVIAPHRSNSHSNMSKANSKSLSQDVTQ